MFVSSGSHADTTNCCCGCCAAAAIAPQSVYSSVMRNALRQGVLVVKAAGNSGEDGPFTADVFTAVGAISAASVGDDVLGLPLDASLVASRFSSYGPVSCMAAHWVMPGCGCLCMFHTGSADMVRQAHICKERAAISAL